MYDGMRSNGLGSVVLYVILFVIGRYVLLNMYGPALSGGATVRANPNTNPGPGPSPSPRPNPIPSPSPIPSPNPSPSPSPSPRPRPRPRPTLDQVPRHHPRVLRHGARGVEASCKAGGQEAERAARLLRRVQARVGKVEVGQAWCPGRGAGQRTEHDRWPAEHRGHGGRRRRRRRAQCQIGPTQELIGRRARQRSSAGGRRGAQGGECRQEAAQVDGAAADVVQGAAAARAQARGADERGPGGAGAAEQVEAARGARARKEHTRVPQLGAAAQQPRGLLPRPAAPRRLRAGARDIHVHTHTCTHAHDT